MKTPVNAKSVSKADIFRDFDPSLREFNSFSMVQSRRWLAVAILVIYLCVLFLTSK